MLNIIMKFFPLTILIVFYSSVSICAISKTRNESDQQDIGSRIQKFTNLVEQGMSIAQSLDELNLSSLNVDISDISLKILKIVGELSGTSGLILTGLGGLTELFRNSTNAEREIIKGEFSKVHIRFDAMKADLNEIKQMISDVPFHKTMMEHIEHINTLITSFSKLSLLDEERFMNSCKNHDPAETLDYFYRNRENIAKLYSSKYDRLEILEAMKQMAQISINGIKMIEACNANKFNGVNNTEDKVKPFISYIDTYKNETVQFLTTMKDAEFNITRDFFPNDAHGEIRKFVGENSQLSHADFVSQLFDFLKKKYFWRDFLVGSYSDDVIGYDTHYYNGNDNRLAFTFRDPSGRSWFVTMPSDTGKKPNITEAVDKCLLKHAKYYDGKPFLPALGCDNLYQGEFKDCIKSSLDGSVIICVIHTKELEIRRDEKDGIYVNNEIGTKKKDINLIVTT